MRLTLEDKHHELRQSTRAFARGALAAGVDERERDHDISPQTIEQLSELGLLGVNISTEYGGANLGVVSYAIALREIAAVDASVAVTMAVTNMVGEVIARFGTPAQRERYVPSLTSGEFFGGAFALSEPGAGSDAAGLRTRATKTDRGWLLNGEKMWITTGDKAGVIVVWARTQDGSSHRGITCFLVEHGAAGLSAGRPEGKMGLWGSHTVSLALTDVEVPDDAMLGEEGEGFSLAMMALDGGRIGIGSQAMGMGTRALEEARAHVMKREQFGGPLADKQAVQFALADMATELDAAWLLTLRAAALKETSRSFGQEAAMAKMYASESANRAIRRAVQLLGGAGYMEGPVARLFRDCRVTQIYEGTSEIQRLVIARSLLKE